MAFAICQIKLNFIAAYFWDGVERPLWELQWVSLWFTNVQKVEEWWIALKQRKRGMWTNKKVIYYRVGPIKWMLLSHKIVKVLATSSHPMSILSLVFASCWYSIYPMKLTETFSQIRNHGELFHFFDIANSKAFERLLLFFSTNSMLSLAGIALLKNPVSSFSWEEALILVNL